MSAPIVSIIVPTKNSTATLEHCLRSIKNQTYKQLEIIVVDNFSTDNTVEIARQYADQFYQKGPERSTQRNSGAIKAKGIYLAIIDSDMYLEEHVIEDCVAAIKPDGIEGLVIPEESIGEGFWAKCKALERSFYVGVDYMEAARFFKRTTYLQLGGYDVAMVSGEDWDLSQRVQQLGELVTISHGIKHDEQHISLLKTIKKKFYYAKKFAKYTGKNKQTAATKCQTSLAIRYWLFLSQPSKLWRHPVVGLGMLFMKTCEFGISGFGLVIGKLNIDV
jgi:glycosyltransferase involved in cell wall biosynthesis